MLHELPWLSLPTQDERDELKKLDITNPVAAMARLAALSNRRWNASEFNAVGRKLNKLTNALGRDWRKVVKKEGFLPLTLLVLSSNTASHLGETLAAAALARGIVLDNEIVEYQEPEAWLADHAARLSAEPPDIVLLSLDRNALRLQSTAGNVADAQLCVNSAIERVTTVCKYIADMGSRSVFIENLPFSAADPQGSVEAWLPGSPRTLTSLFNQKLVDLKSAYSYILFDVAGIAEFVGQDFWKPGRYWYTAKMPFSPDCAPLYAHRFASLVAASRGKSRRVLVMDLDNTLWGGVIGDDGLDGISLGGDSALGKAHLEIQRMARQYMERGIPLCVASKNTREIALEVFRRHPEMALRESDITIFEINWESKVESIRTMSATLNLGLDAFVFIDDNPAERKQVRDALPDVAVPELPGDLSEWLPVIQAAAYFEQLSFSQEDQKRAEYYRGNVQRVALQSTLGDETTFLQSLQMKMQISAFDAIGRKRIAQLIAKSNQFNLTTRRYSDAQILELENDPGIETFQIRLNDIFGDNGMIAVVICRKANSIWEIDTWLMSCRVLGRGMERATLNILARRAQDAGASEIRGRYIPTPKNSIVKDHYQKLGFSKIFENHDGESEWSLQLTSFAPSNVPVEVAEVAPEN